MPDEPGLVDKEGTYQRLEKGMLLTRITKKKKEEGYYRVRLESRQIVLTDKQKEIPRSKFSFENRSSTNHLSLDLNTVALFSIYYKLKESSVMFLVVSKRELDHRL